MKSEYKNLIRALYLKIKNNFKLTTIKKGP